MNNKASVQLACSACGAPLVEGAHGQYMVIGHNCADYRAAKLQVAAVEMTNEIDRLAKEIAAVRRELDFHVARADRMSRDMYSIRTFTESKANESVERVHTATGVSLSHDHWATKLFGIAEEILRVLDRDEAKACFSDLFPRALEVIGYGDTHAAKVFNTSTPNVRRWRGGKTTPPDASTILKFALLEITTKLDAIRVRPGEAP